MTSTATDLILAHNTGREAERVAMKYAAMRGDAFRFLRGTCHLFHHRMSERHLSPEGPRAWICGDLHLENVGTYLGENGLVYFDVSDFDEAILAPFSWDILRLATSVLVGGPVIGLDEPAAKAHSKLLIESYFTELATGKPRWLERRTATGPIGDLIEKLQGRDKSKFLAKRTEKRDGKLFVSIDSKRALEGNNQDRKDLTSFLAAFVERTPGHRPIKLLDVARRISGTGSLGVARFVILVDGSEGADLLDLKASAPSALAPYVSGEQPEFESQAHRVTQIQTLFQANTPSLLSAQEFRGSPFVLKQLQPAADRLDLTLLSTDKDRFGKAMVDMARLTAWGHLRGAGRYGSATADALIAAASAAGGKASVAILAAATELATINAQDWAQYSTAYDKGAFGTQVKGASDD